MVIICKKCAFNCTDCVLKPKVKAAGGKKCQLFTPRAKKRAPEDKPCRTAWPTSKGKMLVKVCHPDGRVNVRLVKIKS